MQRILGLCDSDFGAACFVSRRTVIRWKTEDGGSRPNPAQCEILRQIEKQMPPTYWDDARTC